MKFFYLIFFIYLSSCSASKFSGESKRSSVTKTAASEDGSSNTSDKEPEIADPDADSQDTPSDNVEDSKDTENFQKPGEIDSDGGTVTCHGPNVLKNSNFESGNVDFSSEYSFQSACSSSTSNPTPGRELQYSVNDDPGKCHYGYRSGVSGNSGKMLVVNLPASGQGEKKFWCQTVTVKAYTTYELNARIRTVAKDHQSSKSKWTINGTLFSSVFDPSPEWKVFTSKWRSGDKTTVEICGLNIVQNAESGDLALDDIKFNQCIP